MEIKFRYTFFLIFFINYAFSQELIYHELDSTLHKRYQFSSIRIVNDSIFLIPESSREIIILDYLTKKFKDFIKIKYKRKEQEKEGFAILNNLIFFSDEYNKNSIHLEDLSSNREWKIVCEEKECSPSQNYRGDFGLEGIEINKKGNYLYVLQEKYLDIISNNKRLSKIYCFNISFKNFVCYLNLDKTIEITHPNKYQRYTDLTLSEDQNRLYLIRSEFNNYTKKGKYFIDTIDLKNIKCENEKVSIESKDLTSIDLTSELNKKGKEYDNNIEGITAYKNSLFLVSDNCHGRGDQCKTTEAPDKRTMLLEIKF